MEFNLAQIWQHMGVPAMVVAVLLLGMGMASLTVLFERVITLRMSRAASRRFAAAVCDDVIAANFPAIIESAGLRQHQRGHLSRVIRSGLEAYQGALQASDVSGLAPTERTRRHLERFMEEIGTDLRRGMPILASVGSTAPFVGLLGTVIGIITAFQGIASSGSGGLSAVSAGISEALVETALGLAVAIPAVLAFNYLSNVIAAEERTLHRAAGELLDTIEHWDEQQRQHRSPSPRVVVQMRGQEARGASA